MWGSSLSTMNHAIPFFSTIHKSTRTDNGVHVATAFLVTHRDVDYLVSAAHVPSGMQPTKRWSDWSRWMSLRTPEGDVHVDLFSDGEDGTLQPEFGFRSKYEDENRLQDIMWMSLTGRRKILRGILSRHFTRFSLDVEGDRDSSITAYGFPMYVDRWPELKVVSGKLLRLDGMKYMADIDIVDGFSGGPVLDHLHNLVGVAVGRTDDESEAIIGPRELLRDYIENP